MGVDNFYLREISNVMETYPSCWGRMTCLGYPDLLVDLPLVADLFGDHLAQDLPIDPRQDQIRSWHNFRGDVYDSLVLFSRLGYQVTVLDKIPHRGLETLIDLNDELPQHLYGSADLVIDTGTLEHCFNVGTAFKNMCELVGVGGLIMTAAPANKLGHGYYNFCDNVYHDGFKTNGFEIISVKLLDGRYREITPVPTKKIGPPPKSIWLCVARRVESRAWRWPVQGAYL